MSGVRIPPPRPSPSGYATEKGSSLRVSAAGSLFALLDGGCSSPGRAPDCGSGGSGFETRQPPHSKSICEWSLDGITICQLLQKSLRIVLPSYDGLQHGQD